MGQSRPWPVGAGRCDVARHRQLQRRCRRGFADHHHARGQPPLARRPVGTVVAGAGSACRAIRAPTTPACCSGGTIRDLHRRRSTASPAASTCRHYTTLNVNNLTTNIARVGVDGIYFRNTTSSVAINSDTGPFGIVVNGLNADGIYAFSTGTTAVHHAGDISSSSGYGIFAGSTGNLTEIISEGDITARLMGIAARGSVGVSIENTGDVVSTNDIGILARSYGAGGASILDRGAVTAHDDGIMAVAPGAVTIDHQGTILASRDGISATSFGSSIQIASEGIIVATRTGIDAEAQTAVSIDHFGLILAGARGIEAISLGSDRERDRRFRDHRRTRRALRQGPDRSERRSRRQDHLVRGHRHRRAIEARVRSRSSMPGTYWHPPSASPPGRRA